jgi:hypothetical protein
MEIRYTNLFDESITSQQKDALDRYYILHYDAGQLKIREQVIKHRGQTFRYVTHYLGQTEDKEAVLHDAINLQKYDKCIVYFNRQSANGFSLWDKETYNKESNLIFKGKEVFDSLNRTILNAYFDLNTNMLKAGARKFFYTDKYANDFENILFEFSYMSDGSMHTINDLHDTYGYRKGIYLDDFLTDEWYSQHIFPWDQHPYYHSVYPFLPEGPL